MGVELQKVTCYNVYKAERTLLIACKEALEQIINPGINEIQYGNVQQVLDSLHGYLSVTEDAVNDLKVFPLDKLLASFEQYAIEFLLL